MFCRWLCRCEALEGLQTPTEVVGVDEVVEVPLELVVGVVVEALDGRFLKRPVMRSTWPLVQGWRGLVSR